MLSNKASSSSGRDDWERASDFDTATSLNTLMKMDAPTMVPGKESGIEIAQTGSLFLVFLFNAHGLRHQEIFSERKYDIRVVSEAGNMSVVSNKNTNR